MSRYGVALGGMLGDWISEKCCKSFRINVQALSDGGEHVRNTPWGAPLTGSEAPDSLPTRGNAWAIRP